MTAASQKRTVTCKRDFAYSAAEIWSWVGDYFGDWHPAIRTCEKHIDKNGREYRRFIGTDGGNYEEELRYFSDTAKRFSYTLTEGIPNILSYHGDVMVSDNGAKNCTVIWQAEIEMENQTHLDSVAAGTTAIFEAGFDWLEEKGGALNPKTSQPALATGVFAPSHAINPDRQSVGDDPQLSTLVCPKNDAKTLVLCLHGIGGNATNWMPQMAALGDHYWMAALDCRGYGRSSLGPSASTIEDYCNDIVRVFSASGAKRLILVGLSMGSWIAASFAMRYPKLLDGLVFAGGCTGMSEAPQEIREGFRKSRSKPLLAGGTTADMADEVVSVICAPDATADVKTAMAASMAAIPNETYLDAVRCFTSPSEVFDFAKIGCPVLMLTGEHDRLAPPEEIEAVSKRIRDASSKSDIRYEVIAGAGHICNLEAPERFNHHLAAFLARFPTAQDSPASKRKAEKRHAKQRQILMAALQEFSLQGFDGVSMDRIAAQAKVSKPTLYQYFGDKEQLFDAVLSEGSSHILTPLTGPGDALVDLLWDFSWTYAEYVLRPEMLSMARLILGEASRRPDSAKAYYQSGPHRAFQGVHDFIKTCVEKGMLAADDTALAAEHLWSLILSGRRDYHLHFVDEIPTPEELGRNIFQGLTVFLKAYSTQPEQDLKNLAKQYSKMQL